MSKQTINTVQIQNTNDLVRDLGTKAVLNTDIDGLRRYKATRRKTLEQRKESEETKQRLSHLEVEMQNLRKIISELTNLKR